MFGQITFHMPFLIRKDIIIVYIIFIYIKYILIIMITDINHLPISYSLSYFEIGNFYFNTNIFKK